MSILDDFKAVQEQINPTLWYIVSDMVPPGKSLTTAANDFFPEVHYFNPENWARVHRELSDAGCRLRDFRSWRPKGATAPTIIEAE